MKLTSVPTLARRDFLRVGLTTLAGFDLAPMARPSNVVAKRPVKVRGAAEYCIFLFLKGGAPQLDTWDLKEGPWTPANYDVRKTKSGIQWPFGQFPKLAEKLDRVALARSIETWESAHNRAQYYMQVGHVISPARVKEIPSVGAVIAYEFQARRKSSDYLPPFVVINYGADGLIREGCLPGSAAPLSLMMQRPTPFVVAEQDQKDFGRRWELLQAFERADGPDHEAFRQFEAFYGTAYEMMRNPGVANVLALQDEDRKRYGSSAFGDGCLLARQLVQAGAGARYIVVTQDGWDLHANMYNPKGRNHYTLCRELDDALTALLTDLEEKKTADGRSLLDKTFVVSMGEFGRTGGPLTVNAGRDHNRFAMTGLFAGAGTLGGQVFGATDEQGNKVVRADWNQKRSIYPEDVVATIYSQLGIDWTKKITNTPSGRAFEYIEQMSGTEFVNFGEISRLFV